jgi:predicted acyl esterase
LSRRLAAALLGAAAIATFAPAAAAAAAPAPSAYRVAVSQPDELGLPVSLDTDVYLPAGAVPGQGWPLVVFFHGGGNQKREGFVVQHADALTAAGYAVISFSSRGHGDSDGQTTVAGPKETRDLFDVLHWALASFPLDRSRIALGGESQGGLHTNGGQAHSDDPALNPDGIRFRALLPGNTPDFVREALIPNGVVKLSFGLGLIETYLVGARARMSPLIHKWIDSAALDLPGLTGDICDSSGHDTLTSSTTADLAFRSPGCYVDRMTVPTLWAQAFDDGLFTPEMAISMWRQMPNPANRIYLTMGGHAAPFTPANAERDELAAQVQFLDSVMKPGAGLPAAAATARMLKKGRRLIRRGKRLKRAGQRQRGKRLIKRGRKLVHKTRKQSAAAVAAQPKVVYWRRDPRVAVPSDSYRYPESSWSRFVSSTWPPPGTAETTLALGADGVAGSGAAAGALPLAPLSVDEANDPVTAAALSATPIGTSPVPAKLPATDLPGFIAAFQTAPFAADRELSGQPRAGLAWTPLSPDTQLVLKLFDRAPDGTVTLLSRGVQGIRAATPGVQRQVTVAGNAISALIPAGHTLLAWVSAGELGFYKPFVGSLGGVLAAGTASTLTIPLRSP